MTQKLGGLYAVLRPAWAYMALQRLIARKDARRVLVERYIQPRPGDRIVDIGCGPGAMLPYLGEVDYIGVDMDAGYVENAQRRFGERGRFIRGEVSDVAVQIAGQADIVLAIALLHHLDDKQARTLFRSAATLLKRGGRLVTIDCVWTSPQNPIARLMIAADRGKSTRFRAEYEALASEAFSRVESHLHGDFLRLPYDHCVMVCREPREEVTRDATLESEELERVGAPATAHLQN